MGDGLFISRRAFGDARDEVNRESSHASCIGNLIPVIRARYDRQSRKMIHIGQRIKEIFDQQPKPHNIEWFAEKLHCKRSNIYNIFSRSTIDTDLLFHISKILGHDFFRDMTLDLYRFNNDEKNGKQEIYDDIMQSIGQLLSRKLRLVSLPDNVPYYYALNENDDEASPLPPSEFVVSVKSGEDAGEAPHIHVASKTENFEITYRLSGDSAASVLNIINYGKRPFADSFADITVLINKWLASSGNTATDNIDNQTYATIAYNTLNSVN